MIYINAKHRRKTSPWVFYSLGNIDAVIKIYKNLWSGNKFYDVDLQYWADRFKELDPKELKGYNLACFCPLDQPCHADVLLKMANKD